MPLLAIQPPALEAGMELIPERFFGAHISNIEQEDCSKGFGIV